MYRTFDDVDQLKVMMSQDNEYMLVMMTPPIGSRLYCNYEVLNRSLRSVQYLNACDNDYDGVLDRASTIDRFEVIPHSDTSHVYIDGKPTPLVYLFGTYQYGSTSMVQYDAEIFVTTNTLYSIPKRVSDMIRLNYSAINTMIRALSLWRVECARLNIPEDVLWIIAALSCELFRALDYSRYCMEVLF